MTNKSQINFVRETLLKKKRIDRNFCIREKFITRLSSIVHRLRGEGMEIEGYKVENKYGTNYEYKLV